MQAMGCDRTAGLLPLGNRVTGAQLVEQFQWRPWQASAWCCPMYRTPGMWRPVCPVLFQAPVDAQPGGDPR